MADLKALLLAAAVGGAAAVAAVALLRGPAAKPDDAGAERRRLAQQQAELDAKIRAAVQAQATAIIPTTQAKVYPPIGKPVKQVRGRSRAARCGGAACLRARLAHAASHPRARSPSTRRRRRNSPAHSRVRPSPAPRRRAAQKRVLISGGAGFVGSNLVDVLMMQVRESSSRPLHRSALPGQTRPGARACARAAVHPNPCAPSRPARSPPR